MMKNFLLPREAAGSFFCVCINVFAHFMVLCGNHVPSAFPNRYFVLTVCCDCCSSRTGIFSEANDILVSLLYFRLSFILYTVKQKQIFIQDDPVSQGFGLVRFAVVLAMGELLKQRNNPENE